MGEKRRNWGFSTWRSRILRSRGLQGRRRQDFRANPLRISRTFSRPPRSTLYRDSPELNPRTPKRSATPWCVTGRPTVASNRPHVGWVQPASHRVRTNLRMSSKLGWVRSMEGRASPKAQAGFDQSWAWLTTLGLGRRTLGRARPALRMARPANFGSGSVNFGATWLLLPQTVGIIDAARRDGSGHWRSRASPAAARSGLSALAWAPLWRASGAALTRRSGASPERRWEATRSTHARRSGQDRRDRRSESTRRPSRIAADVAARRQRVHASAVDGAHQRLHVTLDHPVELPRLAGGDLQGAVGIPASALK